MDDRLYYKREFLNKEGHGSHAHILAHIELYDKYYLSGEFSISDCSRIATLEFSYNGQAESLENSMYKLDLLIDTLKEFRKEFKKAAKSIVEENE